MFVFEPIFRRGVHYFYQVIYDYMDGRVNIKTGVDRFVLAVNLRTTFGRGFSIL